MACDNSRVAPERKRVDPVGKLFLKGLGQWVPAIYQGNGRKEMILPAIALAMQDQLKEIGIQTSIEKVSTHQHTAYQFGDVLDAHGNRDYDMIMAGWEADFPDPSANLESLYSLGASSNTAGYLNEEADALISQQKATIGPTQRNDLMFQAFDIITQETA